jgi:hypothetical protein
MRKSFGHLVVVQFPLNLTMILAGIVIFSSILTSQASADYVYQIENYAPLQNGWTLSGQITTDTNTGILTSSDILSWSYSESNGALSYAFSSTNPVSFTSVAGDVIVTPTAIEIPAQPVFQPSGSAATNVFGLDYYPFYPSPFQEGSLNWERDSAYPDRPYPLDTYYSTFNNNNKLWLAQSSPFPLASPPTTASDPWIIASSISTPEPTSIVLLVSGFLTASGFAFYRRS